MGMWYFKAYLQWMMHNKYVKILHLSLNSLFVFVIFFHCRIYPVHQMLYLQATNTTRIYKVTTKPTVRRPHPKQTTTTTQHRPHPSPLTCTRLCRHYDRHRHQSVPRLAIYPGLLSPRLVCQVSVEMLPKLSG